MRKRQLMLIGILIIVLAIAFYFILSQVLKPKLPLTLPPTQALQNLPQQLLTNSGVPKFDHIVIIMMENKPYSEIVGNTSAPYLNSLIHKYALAANYSAVAHPSLPNYIALIGGSTFGISSDCIDCYILSPNLIDQIETAHKSWKAYMESMPSPCFIGNAYPYAQKHDPFIYFNDIRNNPKRCQNIVPYTQLPNDFSSIFTTTNLVWITPNLCDDMHDCSVKDGDNWLSQNVPKIISSPIFTLQNSVLIITWDEAETLGSNQIPTIIIGPTVKGSFVSQTSYNHYSLLHTIETAWGLPPLTINDRNAPLMTDFFKKL